jgi:hypothetical protein
MSLSAGTSRCVRTEVNLCAVREVPIFLLTLYVEVTSQDDAWIFSITLNCTVRFNEVFNGSSHHSEGWYELCIPHRPI